VAFVLRRDVSDYGTKSQLALDMDLTQNEETCFYYKHACLLADVYVHFFFYYINLGPFRFNDFNVAAASPAIL
jgi:hypothetical protein